MIDPRKKIIVVEDEGVVALDISMTLEDAGYEVLGPFRSPQKAQTALEHDVPAFGLLDLNLGRGQTSESVAQRLTDLGCAFVFLTGYGATSHPVIQKFPDAICLSKPLSMSQILEIVQSGLGDAP